jgi:surface antigen
MNIHPKEGSVMEYSDENGNHLAYVDRMNQDGGIHVSTVGVLCEGEYSESLLTREIWKELRPVFIEVH